MRVAALRVVERRPAAEVAEVAAALRDFVEVDLEIDFAEAERDCLRTGASAGARLCARVTGVARAEAAAKTASVKMRHTFRNFIEVCGDSRAFSVYAKR